MSIFTSSKIDPTQPLIIDGQLIPIKSLEVLKINAGKLASGNRINVFAYVWHTGVPGPSVLILGGVHGNEINGIEIVRRTIEDDISSKVVAGSVVIIPLLNVFGFINFSRDVTDGKDVNRSFPGHLNGSLASRVARILTKKILPFVDFALDFHTGGDARYNYPQVRFNKSNPQAKLLAECFDVKYIIEQPLIASSFRKAATDMGVTAVVFEGGESIRLDKLAIESGISSIKNVLVQLGNMIGDAKHLSIHAPQDKVWIKKDTWIRASTPGIFIWQRRSGDFVQAGELLAEIKDPFASKSTQIISTYTGHIFGHNNASVVSLGDPLFNIGYEYETIRAVDSKYF